VSLRSLFFRDLPARHGGTLEQYVPQKSREAVAHYDPEFETFTDGDPTRNKRAQLLQLEKNDLLVFYAGLRPAGALIGGRLYIIGFFTVASVVSIEEASSWPPPHLSHLHGNAHFRRKQLDEGLVVVHGDPRASYLFDRAIMVSDEAQYATEEVETRIGVKGSLKRAIGRWVPPHYTSDAVEWIIGSAKSHA
jgi:hypothetical protein